MTEKKKIEPFKVSHREFVAGAKRNCPHCNLSVPLHETDPSGPKVTGEYAITIPYEKTCPHCKKTFNYVVIASRSKKRR